MTGLFLSLVMATALEAAPSSVECEIVKEQQRRIVCTYNTPYTAEDRTVTFIWHSVTTPQDNRHRTIVLPANHASVYDYRYAWGRAMGEWRVDVVGPDDEVLATTTFVLDESPKQ